MDGSFKCECNDGYALSDSGLSCVDVDECLENPLVCLRGRCRNTKGAYVCECEPGKNIGSLKVGSKKGCCVF